MNRDEELLNKNDELADELLQSNDKQLHDKDESLLNKNDELLRHIADEYIKRYGELLTEEQIKLEQDNVVYPSSQMERRVRKATAQKKYVRYISMVAGLAACIAIVFLVRFAPQNGTSSSTADMANRPDRHDTDSSAQVDSSGLQEQNPGSSSQDDVNRQDALNSGSPSSEDSAQSANPDADASSQGGTGQSQEDIGQPQGGTSPQVSGFEVIPLSFVPSDGFTQKEFIQDREKSVYSFEDSFGDDVVMTLEYAARVPDANSMARLNIEGTIMYAQAVEGYNLLTFVSDGVLHEMTCRYDINTLARFAVAIV